MNATEMQNRWNYLAALGDCRSIAEDWEMGCIADELEEFWGIVVGRIEDDE